MSLTPLFPIVQGIAALASQNIDLSQVQQLLSGQGGRGMPDLPRDMGGSGMIEIDIESPGGRVWFGNDVLGNRLDFQFLGITEFGDGGSANYNAIDVIGRSEAYQVYQGTETREITLSVKFVAQGIEDEDAERAIEREVKIKADWCRALTYPRYIGGLMYPPPLMNVFFGKMFVRNGAAMKAVTTSVQIAYCSDDSPMTPLTLLPYIAQVDMTFRCVYMAGPSPRHMLGADTILRGWF